MNRRTLAFAIKLIMAGLVIAGMVRSIQKAATELSRQQQEMASTIEQLNATLKSATDAQRGELLKEREELLSQQISVWKIQPGWLAASVLVCMFGILPAGLFWHQTLRSFGQTIPIRQALSTYFLGHLGKYVPGKAMVVVIRAAGLRKFGVPTSVAVVSIFVETLVLMAVGGTFGGLAITFLEPPMWVAASAMTMVAASAIPTLPPVFRFVVAFLARKRNVGAGAELSSGLTWRLLGWGWLQNMFGWILLSISLWMLVQGLVSMPSECAALTKSTLSGKFFLSCVAAATLSVVAGFVSMLPGGAGVRELVVTMVLAPTIGSAPALAVAVWMRLVSLIAEVLWIGCTRVSELAKGTRLS